MTHTLPSGYTVRTPEGADLPQLVDLLNACDVADYGATRLYEAAGMRIVRQHARCAKKLPGR